MAITARGVDRAPTEAEITSSLARNPVVKGMPAWAMSNTANHPASRGRPPAQRGPPPRQSPVALEVVAGVARASDHRDHGEGPDDHEGVDEEVVERTPHPPGRGRPPPQ